MRSIRWLNSKYGSECWPSWLAFSPTVLWNLAGAAVPNVVDVPEAYGFAVAGGQFASAYENELSPGGGLYTAANYQRILQEYKWIVGRRECRTREDSLGSSSLLEFARRDLHTHYGLLAVARRFKVG